MPTITDEQLDEQARDVLFHFLKRAKPSREEIKQASIAGSVFSTINRRHQTAGAREATALLYARECLSSPQERQRYLRAAMPGSALVQALPASSSVV